MAGLWRGSDGGGDAQTLVIQGALGEVVRSALFQPDGTGRDDRGTASG
jgi:hypothetical protein